MHTLDDVKNHLSEIENKLSYVFKNKSLLILAFIHRSYINEHREILEHNERLEFLGDSVLGLIVSDYLYQQHPSMTEGELSYFRSRLVEASSCSGYMQKLQVEEFLLLGRGERMNDGRGRESILSDLFEAIVGAIFLDSDLKEVAKFFLTNFHEEIEEILKMPLRNWKSALQDYCQRTFHQTPHYVVISESGPDHNKIFQVSVKLGENELGCGEGSSKKIAQQAAAENAFSRIEKSS